MDKRNVGKFLHCTETKFVIDIKRRRKASLLYQNICLHSVAKLEIKITVEMNFNMYPICLKIRIKKNLLCDDILSEGT